MSSILLPRLDKLAPDVSRQLELSLRSIKNKIEEIEGSSGGGLNHNHLATIQASIASLQSQINAINAEEDAVATSSVPSLTRTFLFMGA